MTSKIIVITGYLAAGKSTFAHKLSTALGIPCFIKDTFKNAICESVNITDREESSRFSAVTFNAMMYAAERLMETNSSLIVEGNFVPHGVKKVDESEVIKTLIYKHGYQSLTYKFIGDTKTLHKRFINRDMLPERGQANMMFYEPSCEEFDKWCHALDDFNIGGKIFEVDTTNLDLVDYKLLIETAREFFDKG